MVPPALGIARGAMRRRQQNVIIMHIGQVRKSKIMLIMRWVRPGSRTNLNEFGRISEEMAPRASGGAMKTHNKYYNA
jgi:hypothetical protein